MAAKYEKPFDVYGCLLQLLLCYYDISKTTVFWTNVVFVLSTATTGTFSRLCLAAIKPTEILVRRIVYTFRIKPLDTRHFQYDTMLMRQQPYREKNLAEKMASLKRETAEKQPQNEIDWESIEDRLPDALDFVLNTKSHLDQRNVGDNAEEATAPRLFVKSTTYKDTNMFLNLNKPIEYVEAMDTSTEKLICPICSHRMDSAVAES